MDGSIMAALVIAEHNNRELDMLTHSLVTAALKCSDEVDVLVMGHQCEEPAQKAAEISHVRRVLLADSPALEHFLAENAAEQILSVAGGYTAIIASAGTLGAGTLPRVAARLGVGQVTEVTRIISADTYERPVYTGRATATVRSADPVRILTVRATSFLPAERKGTAKIEKVQAVPDKALSAHLSRESDSAEKNDLAQAKIIVAGGRGVGSSEGFGLVSELAVEFGGAVAASRAAVEAGFVERELQIGHTGKTVAPDVYFAVGISGALQHIAGIRDALTIVAINRDQHAPIFGVADFGIVGDLHEVLPQLIDRLRQTKLQ